MKLAWPLALTGISRARTVAPSMNVIMPVGIPMAGEIAAAAAVMVTDWPDSDGFADDASVTEL